MPLPTGTRLGPYEIVSPIGAGGMGEVYRAKDTRLNRDVAIKVLPPSFAADPDRRARFEREAQAVAALSHPNVIAIHDTGEHDGQLYVVMELLAGSSLRERIPPSGLPIRKAVDIAVQIARGLGAAHGKGIVHRDLKPENVFLLDDGQVKILDFGLARQAAANEPSGATQTMAATDPGTVMGTIGYMAPEQVRGQAVDARADVFAFGAVLYEMVAGRRAFQRETAADTMTAILTQDPPDLTGSRPDLSPALDRMIRHCFEKNANERFQNARDIAFALETLSGSSGPSVAAGDAVPATQAPPRFNRRRWTVATAALVAIAIAVTAWIARQSSAESTDIRYEAKTFESEWITNARFAPDGQTIIYSAASTGTTPSLYVVRAGELAPHQIAGPGTHLLSVSKTGELAVLTGAVNTWKQRVFSGTLSRMTMNGAARPWMTGVTEADWAPDGQTLAIIRENNGTWTLEYPAGKVLFSVTRGYLSDPRVSPDGKHVVFFDHSLLLDDRGWVKLVDQSGVVKTLAGEFWGEEGAAWSPDSQTVYFSAPVEGAQNYQVSSVNIAGPPEPRRLLSSPGTLTGLDVSSDGRMLVMSVDIRRGLRALVPGEAVERELPWLNGPAGAFLSRNGSHVAFNDTSAGKDYAVAWRNTNGSPAARLGPGFPLALSPDGKWIAAQIPSTGQPVFYPTGTGEPIAVSGLVMNAASVLVAQWFSDSRHVLLCGAQGNAAQRCYRAEVRTGATPEPMTSEGALGALLGSDDRTLLLQMQDRTFRRSTIGGGAGTPLGFIRPDDTMLALSRDLKSVYVKKDTIPAGVERIDLATGARSLVKTIGPPESTAVINVEIWNWQEHGGHVYTYIKQLSQLFVVSGIRN